MLLCCCGFTIGDLPCATDVSGGTWYGNNGFQNFTQRWGRAIFVTEESLDEDGYTEPFTYTTEISNADVYNGMAWMWSSWPSTGFTYKTMSLNAYPGPTKLTGISLKGNARRVVSDGMGGWSANTNATAPDRYKVYLDDVAISGYVDNEITTTGYLDLACTIPAGDYAVHKITVEAQWIGEDLIDDYMWIRWDSDAPLIAASYDTDREMDQIAVTSSPNAFLLNTLDSRGLEFATTGGLGTAFSAMYLPQGSDVIGDTFPWYGANSTPTVGSWDRTSSKTFFQAARRVSGAWVAPAAITTTVDD